MRNIESLFLSLIVACNALPLVSSFTAPTSGSGLATTRRNSFDSLSRSNKKNLLRLFSSSLLTLSADNANSAQESKWKNAVSIQSDAMQALEEILAKVQDDTNGDDDDDDDPDIGFLFVSQFHGSAFTNVVQEAARRLSPSCRLLAVVGSGVIGEDRELEESTKPSISLLLGHGIASDAMEVFDFNELHKPPPPASSEYWCHLRGSSSNLDDQDNQDETSSSFLIFADPWSPVENVTQALGSQAVVAGGISVPTGTGPTVAKDGQALPQGSLVGVRFSQGLQLQVVTAQGCRPVPHSVPNTITAAEGSCILELDGQPAIQVLESIVSKSSNPLTGLVCGIQASNGSSSGSSRSNDYLIRQIVGFVPTKGGIAVAGGVHIGDRLQFHVRDKEAAQDDLQLMLKRAQTEQSVFGHQGRVVCAFQISCVARGRSFFGAQNVDLEQTKSLLSDNNSAPVAGFFANGELGPVGIAGFTKGSGSVSHIHGFTTVMAYLCDTTSVATKTQELQPVLSPLADDPTAWA